jgi:hypothetical protein
MASNRIRKTVSGTGVFMLSVFVTAFVIHFNDWMKDHSWAVTFAMYASPSIALICFLLWFRTRDASLFAPGSISPTTEQQGNATTTSYAGNIHLHR